MIEQGMKLTEIQTKKPWHYTEVDSVVALRAHANQIEKGYYIRAAAEIMNRAANELEHFRGLKNRPHDGLIDYSESDFQSWNAERERLLKENRELKARIYLVNQLLGQG